MANNQTQLLINASIVEDWQDGYKLEIELTAESDADDWRLDFDFSHTLRAVYGVELAENDDNSYSISGLNAQSSLEPGQSIQAIFIVDRLDSDLDLPVFAQELMEQEMEPMPEMTVTDFADSPLTASSVISEDWNEGYKLEVDLTAESDANDWKLDFHLPYNIRTAYGVELVDNGAGSYTISGQNNQTSLAAGESIKPIFIVDDGGQEALELQFGDISEPLTPEPEPSPEAAAPEPIPEPVEPEPVPEPTPPVDIPETPGESVGQQGQFSYGEALQKNFLFFEAN
ncbi:MAG: hypothetical protein AAFQ80_18675, partial [Cyanobacteria bacterium J06621_8]